MPHGFLNPPDAALLGVCALGMAPSRKVIGHVAVNEHLEAGNRKAKADRDTT